MSLPYTPLENLLLFRGIAKYGLDAPSFTSIAHALQNNPLIKGSSTYDAGRLGPERLQERFLHLLGEELKADGEPAARPGVALSPTSKKRKLQAPPPDLEYARSHVDKIEAAHQRLQDAYIDHVVAEIGHYENQYEEEERGIRELEAAEREEQNRIAQERAKLHTPVVPPPQPGLQHGPGSTNGVAPAPPAVSPRPPVVPPVLSQSHAAPNAIKPASPVRQPLAPATQTPFTPTPAPVLARPQPTSSPRPGQQPPTGVPVQEAPRPSDIQPVLQQPPGTPFFQRAPQPPPVPASAAPAAPTPAAPAQQPTSDVLRRPEGIVRPKPGPTFTRQAPTFALPQQPAPTPSQYQWEAYQPNASPMRQTVGPGQPAVQAPVQPHHNPQQGPSHQQVQQPRPVLQQGMHQQMNQQFNPQAMNQQAVNQQAVHQQAMSPQTLNPPTQQMMIPPGQYASPVPPVQARPPPNEPLAPVSNRQPLLAPNVQPNTQVSPPAHHGYNQPPQQNRSPAIPPQPASSTAAPPRPPPGLVQQRAPPQPLQAPPPFPQQTTTGHPPASSPFTQPDPQRTYNSPYPVAPRPAVPDRVQHPRAQQLQMPGTPGSAIPARPPVASLAPQTPGPVIPLRLVTGVSTKWGAKSTPSTPLSGPGSYFGSALPESPAYEPLSPVLTRAPLPSPLAFPPAIAPPASKPPVTASPAGPSSASVAPKSVPGQEQKKPSTVPEPVATTPTPKRKVGRPRNLPKTQDDVSPPKPAAPPLAVPPLTIPPAPSPQQAIATTSAEQDHVEPPVNEPESAKIKDEVTTPAPLTETGDTTADESVTGRRQAPRVAKRKRNEDTPTPAQTPVENRTGLSEPPAEAGSAETAPPPNEVLWTRGFNKISGSTIEQTIQHRSANMFKVPVREKDAPGYHKVVLQPQDLKTIKAAITAGNKAAAQQAAALPGGDPNTSIVWLPVSEALQPPKGIINSGQLDRELAHMFANAIMYNPDPGHGPGPSFLVSENEAQAEGHDGGAHHDGTLGYKVDEFGVVNDTRGMFMEVDKLVSELRSAEVRRTGGARAGGATGTSTRQASVTQGDTSMARDEHNHNAEDDEHTATEVETTNPVKRRRTTRL